MEQKLVDSESKKIKKELNKIVRDVDKETQEDIYKKFKVEKAKRLGHLPVTNKVRIYYIFSSISFLQFYIPLVIHGNSLNFQAVFIIRENIKTYTCPIQKPENAKLLTKYAKKYDIEIISIRKVSSITGIVFLVDGDVYGPGNDNRKESVLYRINLTRAIKISLTEHLNFKWAFRTVIPFIHYYIFPNPKYLLDDKFKSKKVLYLGNTKFDNIITKEEAYAKFNLNKSKKYVLILFPKEIFQYDYKAMVNLYDRLRKLGYSIIVKDRPKKLYFSSIPVEFQGDKLIVSELYPNETLQLLRVAELCIVFSSSAVEETIMMKVPVIDFQIDKRKIIRLTFLEDTKVLKRIKKIPLLKTNELADIINGLEKKDSGYFDKIIRENLFTHKSTSAVLYDLIVNGLGFKPSFSKQ